MGREGSHGFFSELARSVFGTLEHDPYLIADEIRPVVVLEAERPEWLLLQGQRRYGFADFTAAVGVGNFNVYVLSNAAGSGVLGILEEIWSREGNNANVWAAARIEALELTGVTDVSGLIGRQDSRVGDVASLKVGERANASNPLAGGIASAAWPGGNSTLPLGGHPYRRPLVIHPGFMCLLFFIDISTGSPPTNNAAFWSFSWREKLLASAGARV